MDINVKKLKHSLEQLEIHCKSDINEIKKWLRLCVSNTCVFMVKIFFNLTNFLIFHRNKVQIR